MSKKPFSKNNMARRRKSWIHRTPISLRAQILKTFKIAWNFQSRLKISLSLEMFNPDLQNSPQKNRGLVGGSLENFKLALKFQDLEFFQDLGP